MIFDYPEGFNVSNATEAASASAASSSQAAATSTGSSSSSSSAPPSYPTSPPFNINYPPYAIDNYQGNADLAIHAVSPNATHVNGVIEYNVHNIYGFRETKATYESLKELHPERRPFIVGRSTFPGSGMYGAHWGGDNYSQWLYMYYSIAQALIFQLFGIPMIGPDTCGFNGNSDNELCSRWMQLSAFFPFYRNHNVLSANSQEAYVWSSVITASKSAMSIRYQLLPYWYTLLHKASSKGTPVLRALFWEFPDQQGLQSVDTQFFVGSGLLVSPVLEPATTSVSAIFPGISKGSTRYYDWYTQSELCNTSGNLTISAPLGHIPVHLRGGCVIPTQVSCTYFFR